MEGFIFNILKFCIHDGPGIRTTVFFKGCPLRCEWCANPESQAVSPQVLYNNEKCLHCETCVHTCPKGAIKMEDGLIRIDHKTCDHCMKCVKACPGKALTQEGEIKTVEEVVDICMQDIDFYEESNGGVTLSGGEAQRVKLASELQKKATGKTLFVLDEPTTGLHSDDVKKLIDVLQRLVEHGDTVLVIEHNLDVIKCADQIIDMGPEGGQGGGTVICTGTPEKVAACKESYTGQYLKPMLTNSSK